MRKHVTTTIALAWPISRQLLPLMIGAACLWLVTRQLGEDTWSGIGPALAQLEARNWIGAILATAVSFWALGRYDVILHRHLDTGIPARTAALSGAAAIALSQVLGLGAVTGALVRWRSLPALSAAHATQLTLAVAMTFLIGLSLILGLSDLIWGVDLLPDVLAFGGIALFCACLVCSFLVPRFRVGDYSFTLPSIPTFLRIAQLALIDTVAAALALYLLLPESAGIGLSALYPAYLAALLLALITGTPGGVGPFELALLACLPQVEETTLLLAIVAFRLVYYALPALLAMLVLARPQITASATNRPALSDKELSQARRSELGVCRQNGATKLGSPAAALAIVETQQSVSALFEPISGGIGPLLPELMRHAIARNRTPLIYKCGARVAARARRAGWRALHIADEALIDPTAFSDEGPRFRQLRRKLRQADSAGVTVTQATDLPIRQMRAIDADWQARNGGARGLSMGLFCAKYLGAQRVYIAWQGNDVIGYISLHTSTHERCLDLMRASQAAPQGTMHRLVMRAIEDAADEGCPRFSLSAMPRHLQTDAPALDRWAIALATASNGAGLSQFKTCFDPCRAPLYALAPGWPSMVLALADLARAIRHPTINAPHQDHENKPFAVVVQT